jgi:hypothetical protein
MIDDNKTYDTVEDMLADLEKNMFFMYKVANKYFPKGICNYNAWHTITHPWIIIRYLLLEIKYAWQRVFRGYDDKVSWSFDYYLAKLVPPIIKEIKEHSGTPVNFYSEDYDFDLVQSEEEEKRAHEEFVNTLDQIIEGFVVYCMINDNSIDCKSEEYKLLKDKFNNGFKLLHKYFEDLWW